MNKGPNRGAGRGQRRAEKQEKEDVTKSCVTDLLSGAESGEIWIKRISRLPENLPTADHKLSFLFLSAQAKILFGCSFLERQNVLPSRR